MKKSSKILVIISFLIIFLLLWANYTARKNKEEKFQSLNKEVESYSLSTKDRVGNAVITLPDGQMTVGLVNNTGSYISEDKKGTVNLDSTHTKIEVLQGAYGARDPRVDAIAPMYVSLDPHGGSMYIVLFNDRGDVALEESYARLGGKDVIIQSIDTISRDEAIQGEEYKVHVIYKLEGKDQKSGMQVSIPKEVIIPVINGHFDAKGTITK
jgi:hypothetical protein